MTNQSDVEKLLQKATPINDSPKALTLKMLLAGQWVDSSERITVINPYDSTVIGTVPCANREQIEYALALARK